jgi:hypothetical protein
MSDDEQIDRMVNEGGRAVPDVAGSRGGQHKGVAVSLDIDVDQVEGVLLADGWHTVANSTFELDAYEFQWQGRACLRGGNETLLPALGARWEEADGARIACPATAVLAVRLRPRGV